MISKIAGKWLAYVDPNGNPIATNNTIITDNPKTRIFPDTRIPLIGYIKIFRILIKSRKAKTMKESIAREENNIASRNIGKESNVGKEKE
jgi:hypothetical protein